MLQTSEGSRFVCLFWWMLLLFLYRLCLLSVISIESWSHTKRIPQSLWRVSTPLASLTANTISPHQADDGLPCSSLNRYKQPVVPLPIKLINSEWWSGSPLQHKLLHIPVLSFLSIVPLIYLWRLVVCSNWNRSLAVVHVINCSFPYDISCFSPACYVFFGCFGVLATVTSMSKTNFPARAIKYILI